MSTKEISNFDECIQFEQDGFSEQDCFYRNVFNVEHIHRYPYNSKIGRIWQKKDIDTLLITDEGLPVFVSEKRHRKNDICNFIIEPYSVYESDIKGWSSLTESDIIVQFMPKNVCEVASKPLVNFTNQLLIPAIDSDIRELVLSNSKSCSVNKCINGKPIQMRIFQTKTGYKNGNGNYTSIGVLVKLQDLKSFGISYKIFNR